jgi:tRNA G26 N,N-dimethylase Trm1
MFAFYQHDPLKAIEHDQALNHIIETVLSEAGTNDSMVVPVAIHFDEHGAFVNAANDCKQGNNNGKKFFEDMLICLGSAATSCYSKSATNSFGD